METHTAYRPSRSVFGIASIPNTDFRSLRTIIFSICNHWFESVWKHSTQHIAHLGQYLGLRQSHILILEA